MSQNVFVKSGRVLDIVKDVTTVVDGAWMFKDAPTASYQAVATGTGVIGATVVIQVSNDGINPVATPLGTIVLTGTTVASDGFTSTAPWKFVRANVTVISGTGTTVSVLSCV